MKHPTFYKTVVHSKEFQAWVKYNESLDIPLFDTPESIECGWLSPEHFEAFLNFVIEQSKWNMCVDCGKRDSEESGRSIDENSFQMLCEECHVKRCEEF